MQARGEQRPCYCTDCALAAAGAECLVLPIQCFQKLELAHRYLLLVPVLNSSNRFHVTKAPSAENSLIYSLCLLREIPAAPWSVSTMAG